MDLQPITRKELYYNNIIMALKGEESEPIDVALTYDELWLQNIIDAIGGEADELITYTRLHVFYSNIVNAIGGDEMVEIEPLTREELYLKAIADKFAGEETELPSALTRDEVFLAEIYELAEGGGGVYYGMIIDQSESDPSKMISYIGKNENYTPMSMNLTTGVNNYGDWADMPTIVKNKPAMIRTDGTFDYWLDENDYTKKADGTPSDVANIDYDGNAFAWFEPIWCRLEEDGDLIDVRFAYSQLDDSYFEVCPEGCGIWIPMFYGFKDGNGKMRSIAGTSEQGGASGTGSFNDQNTAIRANGANYIFYGGQVYEAIRLLLCMWYKNVYSHTWGYGNAKTARESYLENPVVDGGQFYGTDTGYAGNKALHSLILSTYDVMLRNPFLLTTNKMVEVNRDYSMGQYIPVAVSTGIQMGAGGIIKKMAVIEKYGLVPTESASTKLTYWCNGYGVGNEKRMSTISGPMNSPIWLSERYGIHAIDCSLSYTASYEYIGCAMMLKQAKE